MIVVAAVVAVLLSAVAGSADELPGDWQKAVSSPGGWLLLNDAVVSAKTRGGYGDMASLTGSLLKASETSQSPEHKLEFAKLAIKASPGDPVAHAYLVELAAKQKNVGLAVTEFLSTVASLFTDPWLQVTLGFRTLAIAALGFGLVAFIFTLVFTFGYGGVAVHDYLDSFPRRFGSITPLMFILLLAAIGLSVSAGPLVFVLLLLFFLLPYAPDRGKWTVSLGIVSFCAFFLVVSFLSGLAGSSGERAWLLYRVWKGESGARLENRIDELFLQDDTKAVVAKALSSRRSRHYGKAIKFLQKGIAIGGEKGILRMEIGNVHFMQGKYREALEEYDKAAALMVDDWAPWFNAHLAYQQLLELGDADVAFEKAKDLNEGALEHYLAEYTDVAGKILPVSPEFPSSWIRAEMFGGSGGGWSKLLWRAIFIPHAKAFPWTAMIAAFFLGLLAVKLGQGNLSKKCPSCGVLLCPRCTKKPKEATMCAACHSFRTSKDLDAGAMEALKGKIVSWQKHLFSKRRIGRFMLPGWSPFVFEGQTLWIILALPWTIALGNVVLGYLYPVYETPVWPFGFTVASLLVMALAHIVGLKYKPPRSRDEVV